MMRNYENKIRVLAGVLLFAVMSFGNMAFADDDCSSNDATAPCYAKNDDILAGTRQLEPVDDLHLSLRFSKKSNDITVVKDQLNYMRTKDLAIDHVSFTTYTTTCEVSFQAKLQSLAARLFATTNDMLVTMRMNSSCDQLNLHVSDDLDSSNDTALTLLNNNAEGKSYVGMAVADFDRDGYDDVFTMIDGNMQTFTAVCTGAPFGECTDAPDAGLTAGPSRQITDVIGPYAGAPVTGDFDGDGVIDVAMPIINSSSNVIVQIVSVCPAAGVEIPGDGTCSQPFELRNFRQIHLGAHLNLTGKNLSRPTIDIGAGNFDGLVDPVTGRADDELVIALADADNSFVTVSVYDYVITDEQNQKGSMEIKDSSDPVDIEHNNDNGAQVFIEGTQLDPNSLQ